MRDLWLWSSKGVIVIRSEHTGCVTYVNTHPAERLQVRLRLKHTDPETEKENVKLQLESECEGCCWELNPQLWWCCVGDMGAVYSRPGLGEAHGQQHVQSGPMFDGARPGLALPPRGHFGVQFLLSCHNSLLHRCVRSSAPLTVFSYTSIK